MRSKSPIHWAVVERGKVKLRIEVNYAAYNINRISRKVFLYHSRAVVPCEYRAGGRHDCSGVQITHICISLSNLDHVYCSHISFRLESLFPLSVENLTDRR